MDRLFTYLEQQTNHKIINFLDDQLDEIDYLLDNKSNFSQHDFLINYSMSLFVFSENEDNDSVTLN